MVAYIAVRAWLHAFEYQVRCWSARISRLIYLMTQILLIRKIPYHYILFFCSRDVLLESLVRLGPNIRWNRLFDFDLSRQNPSLSSLWSEYPPTTKLDIHQSRRVHQLQSSPASSSLFDPGGSVGEPSLPLQASAGMPSVRVQVVSRSPFWRPSSARTIPVLDMLWAQRFTHQWTTCSDIVSFCRFGVVVESSLNALSLMRSGVDSNLAYLLMPLFVLFGIVPVLQMLDITWFWRYCY